MMRALLVVLLLLVAGCAAPDTGPVDDIVDDATDGGNETVLPDLSLGDCLHVSGVSNYPRAQYNASSASPPDPLYAADIRDEIGDARLASANGVGWVLATGEVAGHWHSAVVCEQATFNGTDLGGLSWGFVGLKIEKPVWDNSSIEDHFLLAVWSWESGPVHDWFHDLGHATKPTEVKATTIPEGFDMLLDDVDHGRYEGFGPAITYDDAPDRTWRFWMLLPEDGHHNHHGQGGPFTPVAFDAHFGAAQRWVTRDSEAFFAHSGTDHHAPLPGLAGNAVMVAWHFDTLDITVGPRLGPIMQETWVH